MPVRKIPKNYLGVTGSFSSQKNGRMLGFESLLERDYMILLEFDEAVETFEEQPVKIPFRKGVKPYVPDILIKYAETPKPHQPVLAEIKHTSDLQKHKDKYAPKFKVAKAYANNREWKFRIVTEEEIRPLRLKNLKFLREYLHVEPEQRDIDRVIAALQDEDEPISVDGLLDELCQNDMDRLLLIPTIWHLVVKRRISIDFDIPISDKTPLSLSRGGRPK